MSDCNKELGRRRFLERLCALGGATATAWTGCAGTPDATKRRNVLLILTEDQGAQMGALGTKGLQTPNMDAIAEQGVLFRSAFVAYPVCSPSKGALYTGLYPHTNGLRGLTQNFFFPAAKLTPEQSNGPIYRRARIHDSVPTLIEVLHDAGYYTGVSMKLHVAPNEKFPFDEWIRNPEEDHCGFIGNPSKDLAVQFIRNAQDKGAPWFLMYNIEQPHRPFRNSDEQHISVNPAEVEIPPFLPDTPVVRKDWAEYLDYVECADALVGDALVALDETGCSDDTLVIFLGDHGPAFQRGKMTLYDFGLRVPMAIKGPGIQPGAVSDDLVSEIDIMPTILNYLGLQRPDLEHGISLLPTLRGEEGAQGHEYIFGEAHHDYIYFAADPEERGPRDQGMQERSIYDGRFHLIYRENLDQPRNVNYDLNQWERWRNRAWDETIAQKDRFPRQYEIVQEQDPLGLGGRPLQFELYDTMEDPYEMTNLAGNADHESEFERLREVLRKWAVETGDEWITLGRPGG